MIKKETVQHPEDRCPPSAEQGFYFSIIKPKPVSHPEDLSLHGQQRIQQVLEVHVEEVPPYLV
jgi:hypothetical protein